MSYSDRDIRHEISQRNRALATGALVLPPRTRYDLEREESANSAEIHMLCARRGKLWSLLAATGGDHERISLNYDVDSASRSLERAYAAKRRLAVARFLLEHPRAA